MEISVGSILDGNVKSITKFGAFIVLPGGRSGLVHISEISHSFVNDVKDHLQEGQQVRVKVVGIDDAGRINLSIKKAIDPPPRPQNNNQRFGFHDSHGSRGGGKHSGSFHARTSGAQKEAPDFESRLKQFLQSSDSRLSDLKLNDKRSSRRSGHK